MDNPINRIIGLDNMNNLLSAYKELLNVRLPKKYQFPVRYNHCFSRIILDWLFKDCWYNYLDKKKTAISQLDKTQIETAVIRMEQWMADQELLIADNKNSLIYRKNRPR